MAFSVFIKPKKRYEAGKIFPVPCPLARRPYKVQRSAWCGLMIHTVTQGQTDGTCITQTLFRDPPWPLGSKGTKGGEGGCVGAPWSSATGPTRADNGKAGRAQWSEPQ